MDKSSKIKTLKIIILYSLLIFFLYPLYQDILSKLIFHYSQIDFRYLIFMSIQIFWCYLLYQIVYQYICLYTFMRIRLSKRKCYAILLKQVSLYLCFYIILHTLIFFVISQQIPLNMLIFNLIIQLFSFIIVLNLQKFWNYSYIFIIFIILLCHFIE